jgi:nucleoside-diphosphate-sugar epimerase
MKVLVTGGAGYVGSSAVRHLLKSGHEVRVLDLLLRGGQSLVAVCQYPGFEIVVADVRDHRVAADAVKGCDAILHLAAVVGTPACDQAPIAAKETNVGATEALLAARDQDQRFIFASTASVYGHVASGHCDEDTVPEPTTLYGRTKLEAERMVRKAENSFIMRPTTAFGVSEALRWDLLVNDLTFRAVTEGTIKLYQPKARRSFVHVDDLSYALCLPILNWNAAESGVFNVGDDGLNITKAQLAEIVRNETDAMIIDDGTGLDLDQRDYTTSFAKIAQLGFDRSRSLSAGVRELKKAARLSGQTFSN